MDRNRPSLAVEAHAQVQAGEPGDNPWVPVDKDPAATLGRRTT